MFVPRVGLFFCCEGVKMREEGEEETKGRVEDKTGDRASGGFHNFPMLDECLHERAELEYSYLHRSTLPLLKLGLVMSMDAYTIELEVFRPGNRGVVRPRTLSI